MAEVIEDENHPARLARCVSSHFVVRGSCHGRYFKKMDGRTLCCNSSSLDSFTCTALPLFTYHNSMRRDGSQSEGTIVSAWQAAEETQLDVLWPCALTLCKFFSLLSCLFTLTMVLQAAPLNYVMFLFPFSRPSCLVFCYCEGQFCFSIQAPKIWKLSSFTHLNVSNTKVVILMNAYSDRRSIVWKLVSTMGLKKQQIKTEKLFATFNLAILNFFIYKVRIARQIQNCEI